MDIAKCGRERRDLIRKADKRLETVPRTMKNQCGGFLRSQIHAAIQYELVAADYKAAGLGLASVACLRKAAGIWMLIDDQERLKACRARIAEFGEEPPARRKGETHGE